MSHLYKASEWQSGSGKWHCIDTSDLVGGSAMWWLPCRILDLSPADFVKMLIEKYNANITWMEEKNLLLWDWDADKQLDMRKFKNMLNAVARKKQFMI